MQLVIKDTKLNWPETDSLKMYNGDSILLSQECKYVFVYHLDGITFNLWKCMDKSMSFYLHSLNT